MAFIYKITNQVNSKIYIGKTCDTIKKRWQKHLTDRYKRDFEIRPLYRAMKKYGIDNFIIEEIEECPAELASEREIYWINFYDSYNNGYNATLGGDGALLCDRTLVLRLWNEGKTIKEIASILKHDRTTIRRALREVGITKQQTCLRGAYAISKKVEMVDDNLKVINKFNSCTEAAKFLINQGSTKASIYSVAKGIDRVCNGRRKRAYKYIWRFSKE